MAPSIAHGEQMKAESVEGAMVMVMEVPSFLQLFTSFMTDAGGHAGAGITAPSAAGRTIATPAWRDAVYHATSMGMCGWNAAAADVHGVYERASKLVDFVRAVTPDAAYLVQMLSERRTRRTSTSRALRCRSGGERYPELGTIKMKYDPDEDEIRLLDCWHCVGWDCGSERYVGHSGLLFWTQTGFSPTLSSESRSDFSIQEDLRHTITAADYLGAVSDEWGEGEDQDAPTMWEYAGAWQSLVSARTRGPARESARRGTEKRILEVGATRKRHEEWNWYQIGTRNLAVESSRWDAMRAGSGVNVRCTRAFDSTRGQGSSNGWTQPDPESGVAVQKEIVGELIGRGLVCRPRALWRRLVVMWSPEREKAWSQVTPLLQDCPTVGGGGGGDKADRCPVPAWGGRGSLRERELAARRSTGARGIDSVGWR
ncbi:hypothetical protein FB451DRAFT_1162531 [Mycena latifolia]|nr:hypothetical protein FB451DRAFT_1162531 [Mycena latifolia]